MSSITIQIDLIKFSTCASVKLLKDPLRLQFIYLTFKHIAGSQMALEKGLDVKVIDTKS